MNKIVFLVLILSGSLFSQQVRTANLYTLISNIKSAMPLKDSYAYVPPTISQQDSFRTIINLILSQQYQLADSLAGYLDYVLYEWHDTGHLNETYYVLMEENADTPGGVKWGWGTFVFKQDGYQEVIIEAPHPLWDTNTWRVGFNAYQLLNTRYFLMAGTHRYANGQNPAPADVAHNSSNMFHVVHQQVSSLSVHSLQVHGFNRSTNPNYQGYPDVILSNGSSNPTQILDSLKTQIEIAGYSVGIFDGVNYVYLGATTNHQGQWSRSQGYSFIHMELEYFIRLSQSEFENILDALYNVFLIPLAIEPEYKPIIPAIFTLEQNYPNPFNSNTTLSFFLPNSSPIQMIIYNVLGEELWRMNLEPLPAGHHTYQFGPGLLKDNPLSGGVYFLTVTDSHSKKSIKITYLP